MLLKLLLLLLLLKLLLYVQHCTADAAVAALQYTLGAWIRARDSATADMFGEKICTLFDFR